MKKLISIVLMIMILCVLFTVPALAENDQGQEVASSDMATMSVTGGTINADGTVSWALGENILTITMPDGSVYTAKVIYNPEAQSPAALAALTVSGTEIPMMGNAAVAATPNATDTIAISTEPADAVVTINGKTVENGEVSFDWVEGNNELAIEVSKEGFETSAYTLNVEYTPVQEEVVKVNTSEEVVEVEDASTSEETVIEPETEANIVSDVAVDPAPAEVSALAALTIDGKEIDLDEFVMIASDEKLISYSFNAAADSKYDLTTSSGTVVATAAEGWTVSSVKLNNAELPAVAADTYSLNWAKANDVEITLKNDSDVKVVYSLILNNALDQVAADLLTINGSDVSYLTSIPAAIDNSYSLQVTAGEGKAVAVTVNGIPAILDANGMLVVPAVTGEADSIVVMVSKEGCLNKTYTITVTATTPVTVVQAVEPAVDTTADNTADVAARETVDTTVNPELPV